MQAVDCKKAIVDPVTAFRARCEARAHLYGAGELDLHDAVDPLEESARLSGLNKTIGTDAVQAIMAEAFRPVREREWAADAKAADTGNALPPYGAESAPNGGTPASTIEALMYVLRGGLSCLADPANRDRLRRCDEAAMRALAERLVGWKDKPGLPTWAEQDIAKLLVIRRGLT